jgi:excisionase family DNA binding protein
MAELPLVLTVEEVAQALRIGRSAAYAGVRSGDIPGAIRIGRSLRVPRHQLDALLGIENGNGPADMPSRREIQSHKETTNDEQEQSRGPA